MRVLVIAGEHQMAAYLQRAFFAEGHTVDGAVDEADAEARAMSGAYDVVVLDLNMPRLDGFALLRQLRASGRQTPVLVLSTHGQTDDRIAGLSLGADDFLPMPFSMEELLARVSALLRTVAAPASDVLSVDDLTIDLTARRVCRAGREIGLSAREYGLLSYLARCAGRDLTRAQILEHVWGYHFDPGTNVVDVSIQRLRKKIDGGHPRKLIETVPRVGYRLAAR